MNSSPDLSSDTPASAVPTDQGQGKLKFKAPQAVNPDFLVALFLLILNFAIYWRSLGGYFLADDFVHVSYLAGVFDGHFDRLFSNFIGNWMQAVGTQFYRPLISLTLALDFAVGKGAAWPFHCSNILFQVACAQFLFLFSRRLLKPFNQTGFQAALLAAIFFSVYPLHPEVVSWVIGRVDSVCLTFALASLWLGLRCFQERDQISLVASLMTMALALMSKEMAVIVPPTLFMAIFSSSLLLQGQSASVPTSLSSAVKQAFKVSFPFFILLGIYLTLRISVLGTVTGGYGGSVGEGFNSSLIQRFTADGALLRVFLPFNLEVFSPRDKARGLLSFLYLSALGLFWVRTMLKQQNVSRYILSSFITIAFTSLWFILSLAPAYQVWNLTDTLQCSRFSYFATAPLCLGLSLLCLPLSAAPSAMLPLRAGLSSILGNLGIALALALSILFGSICYRNNLAWVHASSQVRSFRAAVEKTLLALPDRKKIVVLNVPQKLEGAHMIFNAAMLSVLLAPPLTKTNLSQRVVSFEPVTYGDSELMDVSRLRSLLQSDPSLSVYRYDLPSRKLLAVNCQSDGPKTVLPIELLGKGVSTRDLSSAKSVKAISPQLSLSALDVDFVMLKLRLPESKQGELVKPNGLANPSFNSPKVERIYLLWSGEGESTFDYGRSLSLPAIQDGKTHEYLFPVSERKSWILSGRIQRLVLEFPFLAGKDMVDGRFGLKSVSLLSGESLIPKVKTEGVLGVDGIYQVGKLTLLYDVAGILGAERAFLFISRPNSWFEHYSGVLRERNWPVEFGKRLQLKGRIGVFKFSKEELPQSGYYQLRIGAADKAGNMVGFLSDPINIQVSQF